jgi:multiple sugar transport system ATP-binding protein
MARIRFEAVTKRFGDVVVAQDFNLDIAHGEFFTFLGPSGCGKSTLLHLLAGIETPTAGDIYFDDRRVTDLAPGARDVAMVFQSYALYPHMSVYENLAFPLRNRRVPRASLAEAVEKTARTLGLENLLDRKPRALSGGQRQRVALGRALIRQPQVFLLDEPLSNLDARLRLEMREELKRLHATLGITTVYVTHDQEEAMALSGRIAVLQQGRIQQCGTPEEIYRAPANRFVAEFVGSPPMNFLPADVLGEIPALASRLAPHAGRELEAGVRPADIRVQASVDDATLKAKVVLLEPTGADLWVVGEWNGHRIKGRAGNGARLAPGATAGFVFSDERIYLFERDSGARVDPDIRGDRGG